MTIIDDTDIQKRYRGYDGNPFLKKPHAKINWKPEQIIEFEKCRTDLLYFVQNYVKIEIPGEGIKQIDIWPRQGEMLERLRVNKYNIFKIPRQSAKTTTTAIYYAWCALFNTSEKIGIAANNASLACEIVDKFKIVIENLPLYLQQGIMEYNQGSILLENGSEIRSSATSKTAFRGFTMTKILLDELAFVEDELANLFYTSVYPSISRAKNGQLTITSTPKGMNNLFFKMWMDAKSGKSAFVPFEIKWWEIPRDDQEAFKRETIANIGEARWRQEFECEFLTSANALVKTSAIENIVCPDPIYETDDGYREFVEPKNDHIYVACVDSGEGVGSDYSVCTIIDVSEFPYPVVASYRNNEVAPSVFAEYVVKIASKYNMANLLIENNSIGYAVAEAIINTHDYDNIIHTKSNKGIETTSGGFGKDASSCLKMTTKTKSLGCSTLKQLIENGNIILNDFRIFSELTTFVRTGSSYAATTGSTDDMIMTLVMFAWLTKQSIFKDISTPLANVVDWDSNSEEDDIAHSDLFVTNLDDTDSETIDFIHFLQENRTKI